MTQPFQLLAGGYISVLPLDKCTGWTQKHAEGDKPAYSMRAHVGSRREKRRTPRAHWVKSVAKETVGH